MKNYNKIINIVTIYDHEKKQNTRIVNILHRGKTLTTVINDFYIVSIFLCKCRGWKQAGNLIYSYVLRANGIKNTFGIYYNFK